MVGGKEKRKRAAADLDDPEAVNTPELAKKAKTATGSSKPKPLPIVMPPRRRGPPPDDPVDISDRLLAEAFQIVGSYFFDPLPTVPSSRQLEKFVRACQEAHELLVRISNFYFQSLFTDLALIFVGSGSQCQGCRRCTLAE